MEKNAQLTAYDEAINYLKTSPMFNLSLSSNELFHSNFLYWIWKTNEVCFKKIINSLIGEEDYWQKNWCGKELEVRREYKNFDLSIVEVLNTATTEGEIDNTVNSVDNTTSESDNGDYTTDGLILFVLENKVKSIPYKEQLIEYNTKIKTHNNAVVAKDNRVRKAELNKLIKEEKGKQRNGGRLKKGQGKKIEDDIKAANPHLKSRSETLEPKKVLLSLVKDFPDKPESPTGTLEGWSIKYYREYIDQIEKLNFAEYNNLRTDYCQYVGHLIALTQQWGNSNLPWKNNFLSWIKEKRCNLSLDKRTEEDTKKNYHITDAEELRLHALYHKLNSIKLCTKLESKLKNLKLGKAKVQYIRAQDDKVLYGTEDKKNKKKRTDYFNGETFLIGVGYGYTHNEPILEIKVVHKDIDGYFYIIQVQGGSYSHGIIGQTPICNHKFVDNWMRKIKPEDVDENAYNNPLEILSGNIFIKENNILYPERSTNRQYRHYGENMIYQSRKLKLDVKIADLLNYMIYDVEKLIDALDKK